MSHAQRFGRGGIGFTDDARGIRPWLGGAALGTAGFVGATEYVAPETFSFVAPVITLVPIAIASVLAVSAIGLHFPFFATTTSRQDDLRRPRGVGSARRRAGNIRGRWGRGGHPVNIRPTLDRCSRRRAGRSARCRRYRYRDGGSNCFVAIANSGQSYWCVLYPWDDLDAGSDPRKPQAASRKPRAASREPTKVLAVYGYLLVDLPIASFVLGFPVFLLVASFFLANLVRNGIPAKRARPGIVILLSPRLLALLISVALLALSRHGRATHDSKTVAEALKEV
jgi:hypothetical protein